MGPELDYRERGRMVAATAMALGLDALARGPIGIPDHSIVAGSLGSAGLPSGRQFQWTDLKFRTGPIRDFALLFGHRDRPFDRLRTIPCDGSPLRV